MKNKIFESNLFQNNLEQRMLIARTSYKEPDNHDSFEIIRIEAPAMKNKNEASFYNLPDTPS